MIEGSRINNLKELFTLSENKKSVVVPAHPAWRNPHPAAFIIHLPGIQLHGLFIIGMYIYKKPAKRKRQHERLNYDKE